MSTTKQQIDLRGLTCPEPVIRTKKLLDSGAVTVEALVDDDVCVNNLQRLARSLKAGFSVKDNNGYFTISIEKGGTGGDTAAQAHQHAVDVSAQASGSGSSGVGEVIFIGKDTFGDGDPEFSRTLLNVFLQTMFDSGQRPRAILMANTGVKLMAKDSQTLKVLNDFKNDGVEVLACGLCVDFYKLKDQVPVEQITNMFAICEYLFAADKVITP